MALSSLRSVAKLARILAQLHNQGIMAQQLSSFSQAILFDLGGQLIDALRHILEQRLQILLLMQQLHCVYSARAALHLERTSEYAPPPWALGPGGGPPEPPWATAAAAVGPGGGDKLGW